jgi:Ulp1 family protease
VIFNSGSGGEIGEELRRRLQRLYRVLRKEEVEIAVTFAENLLYQSNGYDCGVYAVGFSEYVMKEVVVETEEGRAEAHLDNLAGNYKYLLCNSTAARERYRRLLEEEILKSTNQQTE